MCCAHKGKGSGGGVSLKQQPHLLIKRTSKRPDQYRPANRAKLSSKLNETGDLRATFNALTKDLIGQRKINGNARPIRVLVRNPCRYGPRRR
ncbi:MAG: hypothetical protein [Circular genetic element sp.]|nr:MAG: hypothetical protein [Circular genetic element sp.]